MTPDCHIAVRSAAELLAYTPYVFGFHPADSIVLIGTEGAEVTFGARYDLPPPGEDDSPGIARVVARQQLRAVTVIGYGPPERATPAVLRVAQAVTDAGVRVEDALRVTDGRWWSCFCEDPHCCPAEGRPCAPPDNPIAAQAVFRGKVALPDREALVAQVAAVTGPARVAMAVATARAHVRMTDLSAADRRDRRVGRLVRRAGRLVVQEAERRQRAGRPLTDNQVAWLGVLLVHRAVLRHALTRTDDQEWRIRLWTDVLRRVEGAYVPAPACLLALAAWRVGNGALARVAIDRALRVKSDHPLVRGIDRLLNDGVSPHTLVMVPHPVARGRAGTRPRVARPARTGGERHLRRGTRRRSS